MKFPLSKYHFYLHHTGDTIETIAVSTYGGKTVKGKAKCHPNDRYDEETGKRLAALRCNAKIAEKRATRDDKMAIEIFDQIAELEKKKNKLLDNAMRSLREYREALDELQEFEDEIKGNK